MDLARHVSIGADHAGVEVKALLAARLTEAGYTVLDRGPMDTERVDYPDYAKAVATDVSDGTCGSGILICGTGIGMAAAANKIPGVIAGVAHDEFTATMCREHNNANVLCLGARVLAVDTLIELALHWLTVPFGEGRHAGRVAKILALDTVKTERS